MSSCIYNCGEKSTDVEFRVPESAESADQLEELLTLEWLVTNGLGGYSSGTICGVRTRRYHGLLIAALPAPLGRMVMLGDLAEQVEFPDGKSIRLDAENHYGKPLVFHGAGFTTDFHLEQGLPVWKYKLDGYILEKRLIMPYMQNTAHIIYKLLEGEGPVNLRLRPAVNFRSHEAPVDTALVSSYSLTIKDDNRYELAGGDHIPPLKFMVYGQNATYSFHAEKIKDIVFWMEERRGFYSKSELWSPGHFHLTIKKDSTAAIMVSTHSWETARSLTPEEAFKAEHLRRDNLLLSAHNEAVQGRGKELTLAADQFIISPMGRPQDAARAKASGHEIRTVIAGYPWFTDWGRDTMISLEGLTLVTGRHIEAGSILRTFAHYVRGGLIPNMFPEGGKEGLYHTADATLWFFQAISRYVEVTKDRSTLRLLLPKLKEIINKHVEGSSFGIHVDPKDGLLSQGAVGYQLTWMDAKVDNWVVTPRRGKAVEINALWYNALKLVHRWVEEENDGAEFAEQVDQLSKQVKKSFNEKFWNPETQSLYDVIDGENDNDASCRPNQIFPISLPHPVLDESRWESVMQVVTDKLLTPKGLRSLSPQSPDFKPKYYGDLRSRDAAYHQGTVWAWLIGPYIDAYLKLKPQDKAGARKLLEPLISGLNEAGVGSISEIFDAEPPFSPNGCIAQAWSVAEVLRSFVKTAPDHESDNENSSENSA